MRPSIAGLTVAFVLLGGACKKAPAPPVAPGAGDAAVAVEPTGRVEARREPSVGVGDAVLRALAEPEGALASHAGLADARARVLADRSDARAWQALGEAWAAAIADRGAPDALPHALACADVLADLSPSDPESMGLGSHALLAAGRLGEARDLADQSLAKFPGYPRGPGLLADALIALGRYEDAEPLAEKAATLEPGVASLVRTARLRWLRGDAKGAEERLDKAVVAAREGKRADQVADALEASGLVRLHEGDRAGAEAKLVEASVVAPKRVGLLVLRGRIALAGGDAERAASLADEARAIAPRADVIALAADARAASGDAKKAGEAYAELTPLAASAPGVVALSLATRGKSHDEAVRLAELDHRGRDDIDSSDTYAWALYRAGKLDLARRLIDRATRLGTRDARLWYHAGAIRMAAGDAEAGRKLVENALALDPAFDPVGAPEAKALLAGKDKSPKK